MKQHLLKRIDLYMLKSFLGLFLVTFMISCFILLMQFLWLHVRDLVGKGVEISVLLEFLVYAVASMVPLALPLAILLASLMTFGNLGEKFELTAMKSAGVNLFRIMRSLTVTIAIVSVSAFFFSNYILPKSQMKMWTLIFSLRQKNPELDIPEGEFCDKVPGYQIFVEKKNRNTGMMYGMIMYDYSQGFRDAMVYVADSAIVKVTDDKLYLMLTLYSGEGFSNLDQQQQRATGTQNSVPYQREQFRSKQLLISFDTQLTRYDESALEDQHVSKNVHELMQSIDSVNALASVRGDEQSKEMVNKNYFGRESHEGRPLGEIADEVLQQCNMDSLYEFMTMYRRVRARQFALESARQKEDQIRYNSIMLEDYKYYVRKHEIELHRKFTLSFACLIFFFIGAPLGAIIRKGGLGAPVVISVVLFIVYYIIDNTGYKMAREALWPCWAGMWLSSFVLLPIGAFLTYKAATDSGIFNPEVWQKVYERVIVVTKNKVKEYKNKLYEYYTRSIRRFKGR